MSKIAFNGEKEKVYEGDFSQIGAHQVRLMFNGDDIPGADVLLSGFNLVNEHNGYIQTRREDYTYLYRTYEDEPNMVELCNDGAIYVPPEPIPEPEPYVPTLEDVKEEKVAEMNATQQAVIQQGIDVTLEDGTVEHFTLTDHDQTSLMGLQSQVAAGVEQIPWHTSDEAEHCKFYTNADMALITAASMAYVTWHVTYFRDLRIYIRSLDNKESVEAVTYGMEIPKAYRSEPLQAMMAAQNI